MYSLARHYSPQCRWNKETWDEPPRGKRGLVYHIILIISLVYHLCKHTRAAVDAVVFQERSVVIVSDRRPACYTFSSRVTRVSTSHQRRSRRRILLLHTHAFCLKCVRVQTYTHTHMHTHARRADRFETQRTHSPLVAAVAASPVRCSCLLPRNCVRTLKWCRSVNALRQQVCMIRPCVLYRHSRRVTSSYGWYTWRLDSSFLVG